MKQTLATTLAIARREFVSLFRVPVGWIVIALFLLLTAIEFVTRTIQPGQPATMRDFFTTAAVLMVPLAPAVSMRLFAEEIRTGTLDTLRTAPVADGAAVLGKFGAALAYLACLLLPSLVYPAILASIATEPGLDWGAVGAGYLGLALVAALYLAIGTLASTCTSSQTLAFLGTLVAIVLLSILSTTVASQAPSWLAEALAQLSVASRMGDFARGVLDTGHLAFFASATALALTLATVSLYSRRWR
ncbi:MAG: ABC transporter permease [Phycisphaerales bacterium JB040]